jgi:hypothetical protein
MPLLPAGQACLKANVMGDPNTCVVTYHGSLVEQHGPYFKLWTCEPCDRCTGELDTWEESGDAYLIPPTRWVLHSVEPGSRKQLTCVRPESFTCVPAPRP